MQRKIIPAISYFIGLIPPKNGNDCNIGKSSPNLTAFIIVAKIIMINTIVKTFMAIAPLEFLERLKTLCDWQRKPILVQSLFLRAAFAVLILIKSR